MEKEHDSLTLDIPTSADLRPWVRQISWILSDLTTPEVPGNVFLSIREPTLVKLIQLYPNPNSPYVNGSLRVLWRVANESPPSLAILNPTSGKSMTFQGPYAWLERPGEYELAGIFLQTSNGPPFQVYADVITGLSREQALSMMVADAPHDVETVISSAATDPTPVLGEELHLSFPRYRRVRMTNKGPDTAQVTLGDAATGNGHQFNIAVGETVELGPEILGRHTLTFVSTGVVSNLYCTVALW